MLFLVQGCKYSWNSRIGSTTVRPEDNAVPYIPRFTFPWTTGGRYTNRLGQSRAVNMSRDYASRVSLHPSRRSRDSQAALDWLG